MTDQEARRWTRVWYYEMAQALDDLADTYTKPSLFERTCARLTHGYAGWYRMMGRLSPR